MVFNVQTQIFDGSAGVKTPDVCLSSVQLGDGHTATDLYGVDGRNRCHTVIEVEELMTVHQHAKPRVLAVDLNLNKQTSREK